MIAERLARFQQMLDAARQQLEPETVHQLRVSIRRLQAALRLHQLPRDTWRPLMKLAGEVRNRDITLDLAAAAGLPPTHSTVLQLTQERDQHAAALAEAATAFITPAIDAAPATTTPPHPKRLLKQFLRAGRRAHKHSKAENLHALRLSGKRLRYTIELLAPQLDTSTPQRLRALKQLQDSLGAINDYVTARHLTSDPDFHAFLDTRESHERDRFHERWHLEFGVLGARESWKLFLSRVPET